MTNETYEKILHVFYEKRVSIEEDMDEYIKHEEYTLEEQRYDEGYVNALLWAGMEIARMYYKGEFE